MFKKVKLFFVFSCLFLVGAMGETFAGTCGSANGGSFLQAPTSGLCSSGAVINPTIRPNQKANWNTICGGGTSSPADMNWHWYCDDTQCHATDPNAAYKPFFGAAEIESYSGSFPKPNTVTTWVEQFCSLMNTIPAYSEYNISSCQSISMGDHGGCHCCVMSRVVWTKKAAVSGSCGSANGAYYTSAPTSGLCSYGTASAVSGSGPWTWTCGGTNGGATVSCSASKNVTYSGCGSAAGSVTNIIPSTNLCTDGSRPKVYSGYVSGPSWPSNTIGGDWYWWCGSTMCHATDPYKSYKGTFASTMMESYTGSNPNLPDTASVWLQWFCSYGTPKQNQPVYNNYDVVSCSESGSLGTYGGCDWCVMSKFNIKLKPTSGVCGSSSGTPMLAAPTTNLCSTGNATAVSGTGPWTWTCSGINTGASVSCSAPLKAQCGTANATATYTSPTALCAKGTSSGVTVSNNVYSWTCNGSSSTITTDDVTCSAPQKVNGVCGSANGGSSIDTPSSGLCSSGVASLVTPAATTFSWTCTGVNSGTSASCSATRIPSVCGTANGQSFAEAPTAGLCNIGTAVSATLAWTNYDFSRRKPISVANNSGAVISNSAIILNVPYDADMQADFDDLRFYSSTGTPLEYWMESKTNSSAAKVWVKIPSIPTTGATIYMYYGNATVSSASSTISYNSLTFQDNFDNNNISNWTKSIWGSYNGDIVADNNRMRLRVYRCHNAVATKNLGNLTGDLYLSFDWSRYNDNTWAEYSDWAITVNGTAVNPQSDYGLGSTYYGNYSGSVSNYKATVNGNVDIKFILKQSGPCAAGDHSNSYVWIDNVKITTAAAANTTNTLGAEESNIPQFAVSGPWIWKCASGGSASSTCTATQVPPACGSANGQSFATAPTTGLCAYGNPGGLDWLDKSYSKRKSVSITNSSGATLSNYQVKLSVAYDSDMQADFDDLRFTLSDGITLLNYWIESKTNSSTANVWVKIPSIPTTGTSIYMYYGNPTATPVSSGSNTFIIFDDFSSDTGLWNRTQAGTGGASLTGGEAQMYSVSVSGHYGKFTTKNSYPVTNVGIITRYRLLISGSSCNYASGATYIYPTSNPWAISSYGYTWAGGDYNDSFKIGTYQDNVGRPCGSWGPYIEAKVNTTSNTVYAYRNGTYVYTGALASTANSTYTLQAVGYDPNNYYTQYMAVDYFIMRSFAANEPTYSIGTEQSPMVTLSGSGPWEWYCLAGTISSPKCMATSSVTNGQCPATTNSRTIPTPSCLKGVPSALVNGATAWTWTCTGTGTGTTNVCTATVNKTIDGLTGVADAGSFSSLTATSPNLCSAGSVSSFSGTGPWTWTCTGINGGNNDTGSATKTLNGVCGSVDGSSVLSLTATSPNLCSAGSVSSFSGTGPWTWNCLGVNTGTNDSCSAKLKVSGDCGAVAGTSVTTLTSTSPNLCRGGTVSNFSVATDSWTWMCAGINDGLSVACSAAKLQTLSVSSMLNPEEFNSEQCVWCEYYRDNPEDMNSPIYKGMKESTESGIAVVTPKFQFTYADLTGKAISQYMFAISTGTNPDTANITTGWLVPEKVSGSLVTIRPGVTINRFGSETQLTKQLKYGKTYNWWIKFKNSSGAISSWSAMKSFSTTNHEWPKVGVLVKDAGNEYVQTCSTMINITNPTIYKTDPCYSVCWSDHASGSAPVLDDSRWKCSVCYDASGSPTLCQNLPPATDGAGNVVSRFTWDAEDAIFPSLSNQYVGGQNGRYSFNPIVKFNASLGTTPKKIKLRLRGSDCPLEAAATATTIRPVWIEQ